MAISTIRRRVGQIVSRMTAEEARSALAECDSQSPQRKEAVRKITGGFWSQALDGLVMRKLGVRAGIVKNPR